MILSDLAKYSLTRSIAMSRATAELFVNDQQYDLQLIVIADATSLQVREVRREWTSVRCQETCRRRDDVIRSTSLQRTLCSDTSSP